METPDRDDEPVESWEYSDHQCHAYASEDPVDDQTVWAGYARTKLPEVRSAEDLDLQVPGSLVAAGADGWVGFSVAGDSRDVAQTRDDVERLVDQLVELETTMDG